MRHILDQLALRLRWDEFRIGGVVVFFPSEIDDFPAAQLYAGMHRVLRRVQGAGQVGGAQFFAANPKGRVKPSDVRDIRRTA